MEKTDLQQVRMHNLRRVVDERFDGSKSSFAKAIGRQRQQVYALMTDGSTKVPLGNRLARSIESALALEAGSLDVRTRGARANGEHAPTNGKAAVTAQQRALLQWWQWLLPAQRRHIADEIVQLARANQEACRLFGESATGKRSRSATTRRAA